MGLKYNKLYEPYATLTAPNVESQVIWLIKEGIPKDIIFKALDEVYGEIEQGQEFAEEYKTLTLVNSPSQVLWRHLRTKARRLYMESIFEEKSVNGFTKFQKLWKVIKGEL